MENKKASPHYLVSHTAAVMEDLKQSEKEMFVKCSLPDFKVHEYVHV